jgi:hypothetical protein
MKFRVLFFFGAGFVSAVILGLGPGSPAQCRAGDMASTLGAQKSKDFEGLFGAWIHQARQCHVGDYLVVAPAAAGRSDIIVARNGTPFFMASDEIVQVVDNDHVLYELNRGRHVITFSAYDPARQAWIENYDVNADGTIEMRTVDSGNHRQRQEVPGDDRWLEVVKRSGDGEPAVDDRFTSLKQTRAKSAGKR